MVDEWAIDGIGRPLPVDSNDSIAVCDAVIYCQEV
jgi:hypothetical protein